MSSTVTTQVAVLKKKEWVGRSVRRKEDPKLVTGKGTYVDDVRLLNVLHAAFLRLTHAHARIVRVDLTETLNMPRVVYALTGNSRNRFLLGWVTPACGIHLDTP